MTASASEIIASTNISAVYQALTGIAPHRAGPDRWRAPATWRGGDGLTVSLRDTRNAWHDFVTGDGGGVLDLVVRVHGGNRADALRWVADTAGVALSDKPLSAAERAAWAEERRAIERDLEAARLWQRAAVVLGEQLLATLKRGLFDSAAPMRPEIGELAEWTARLARWRRLDGGALVAEFRWWVEREPQLTAGMVHVARNLEMAEVRALRRYVELTAEEVPACPISTTL